jgi:phosphatidylglycerol:prolipoprotein diacylglycerol transferase
MMNYPEINPVIFEVGPFAIRWYGMAYVLGILAGFLLLKSEFKKRLNMNQAMVMDVMTWVIIGIIIGGRIGYILFYDLAYYLQFPFKIFAVWEGGMSYHGGALGVLVSTWIFAKKNNKSLWGILDLLAVGSTIGIGLGRLANFINGELYGRVSSVPWAMVFPMGGPLPRHPSQLYEAFFEGGVLFLILFWLLKKTTLKNGNILGLYLIGYGVIRIGIECVREPDTQLGLFWNMISMGQILSGAMVLTGIVILSRRMLR